jgi:cell division protein FtsI (penicillin-binding protein 3)
MRSADLRRSAARLRAVGVVLVAVFAGLAVRAAHLSVIDGRGERRGESQTDTVLRLAPARGVVTDRSGAELAVTVSAPSVYAVPRAIADPEATARALARALGGDAGALRRRLEGDGAFVFVRRWIAPEAARAVEALGLPGVGLVGEPRRAYPQRSLAGPLVGFSNIDGEGVRGIEQLENAWLRGSARKIAVERDARGRLLADGGHDPRSAAGGDVALTLDAALQAEAETALAEVVEATGALGGLVVALDPHSGDVLAVAERPGFDPNAFRETPYPTTRSHTFLDALEPGSSLKPFVVAAALEHGAVRPGDGFDCEGGSFRVPGKTIRDTHPHGRLDVAGILRVSSNIGAAKIGYQLGPEPHFRSLRAFGFGEPTGSGFPDESAGLLRSWREWRPVDHATISFGQGISVTPVQLAAATAVFANGGTWRTPRLVLARREADGRWQTAPRATPRRVLRPEVARTVRGMLEEVVTGGTGRFAALRGVRVAGKTGTAQKLDPQTGAYSTKRYAAWFVGIAPAEDPKLVVVAMIDEPKGLLHSGGTTAAPLFARVAAGALGREGLVTEPEHELPALARLDRGRAPAAERPAPPRREPPPAPAAAARLARLGDRVLLPDFRGLTHEEVRALVAGAPFQLELRGAGRAVAQEPAPGSVVAGGRVHVRFEARGGDG